MYRMILLKINIIKININITTIMRSNKDNSDKDHAISVSENIIVIEKEFKNDSCHRDLITGIKDLNE